MVGAGEGVGKILAQGGFEAGGQVRLAPDLPHKGGCAGGGARGLQGAGQRPLAQRRLRTAGGEPGDHLRRRPLVEIDRLFRAAAQGARSRPVRLFRQERAQPVEARLARRKAQRRPFGRDAGDFVGGGPGGGVPGAHIARPVGRDRLGQARDVHEDGRGGGEGGIGVGCAGQGLAGIGEHRAGFWKGARLGAVGGHDGVESGAGGGGVLGDAGGRRHVIGALEAGNMGGRGRDDANPQAADPQHSMPCRAHVDHQIPSPAGELRVESPGYGHASEGSVTDMVCIFLTWESWRNGGGAAQAAAPSTS